MCERMLTKVKIKINPFIHTNYMLNHCPTFNIEIIFDSVVMHKRNIIHVPGSVACVDGT